MRGCTNRFILWTIFIKRHGWGDISALAHAFLAFLGYLWFSMGNIKMARWNGLEILIPKHMWKSKIGLLKQTWAQNPYDAFFLGHPVYHCISQHLLWLLELNPCMTVAQSSWRVSWSGRCPVAMLSVLAPNSYLMSHRRNSPPRPSPSQWIWDKQTNRRTLTSDNPSLALTSKANWFLLV